MTVMTVQEFLTETLQQTNVEYVTMIHLTTVFRIALVYGAVIPG